MKRIIVLFLFVMLVLQLKAQDSTATTPADTEKSGFKFDWKKVYFGGSMGAQFGDVTFVDISPLIGYRFTDKFIAGPGIVYRYLKYRGVDVSFTDYGGKLFARYFINENIFAHTEFEHLNRQIGTFDNSGYYIGNQKVQVQSLLIGGGYRQQIGERIGINFMILFEVLGNPYTPYTQQPIFRVGFGI